MPTLRRPAIAALLLASCAAPTHRPSPRIGEPVLNGIDVLEAQDFAPLAGRRVGLISNHTGLDRRGVSTAELLHRAPNVTLVRLFSPEHGFAGKAEGEVHHAVHTATGLPIHSLYTKERAPDPASLRDLDTLVFDIQDIGCRFYTYVSTMGEAMRAAARHGLRFVVLDRPNPIDGVTVGGAMRDAGKRSFVAWHTLPVRHGMTAGELARMFDAELQLHCDLHVVRMRGWNRHAGFAATGQTWVDPSPNMRSPAQALLYPGVGLLETTNVSVGRGTDAPFELLGAPWLDGSTLAARLNAAQLGGVVAVPVRFRPTTSKFADKTCSGVRLWITDVTRFDPVRLGVQLGYELRRMHPEQWQVAHYGRLLVNAEVLALVERAAPPAEVLAAIERELPAFLRRRARFLLYE
ncbi:MAG: DUF1343 domain-containing protein [Planctomycetes bacterium]|nr:DUF1343 domain-containing protein [Planctomycetota bacterium]